MFTSGSLRTLQYLTPFLNLQATKHCVNRSVCKNSLKMKILLSVRGFTTHTHFLHLSQLYMLSPGKQKKKNNESKCKFQQKYSHLHQTATVEYHSVKLFTFKFICSKEGSEAVL